MKRGLEKVLAGVFASSLILCSCGKDNSVVQPKQEETKIERIQSKTSDINGKIIFQEINGLPFEVNLVSNGNPVQGKVSYVNADDSETFIYLPDQNTNRPGRIFSFPGNNLSYVLDSNGSAFSYNLDLPGIKEYFIDNLSDRRREVKSFLQFMSLNKSLCSGEDFGYVGTINGETLVDNFNLARGFTLFLAGQTGSEDIIALSTTLQGLEEVADKLGVTDYVIGKKFDVFDIDQYNLIGGWEIKLILPSNLPKVEITNTQVTGSQVRIEYSLSDKENYFGGFMKDPTFTCFDRNPDHDLVVYAILNGVTKDLGNFNSGNYSSSLEGIVQGNNTLELRVLDEVNNESSTGVEISSGSFGDLNIVNRYSIPLVEGRLFMYNNGLWIHNSSQANKVNSDFTLDLSSQLQIPSNTYDIVDLGARVIATRPNEIIELSNSNLAYTKTLKDDLNSEYRDFTWNGNMLLGVYRKLENGNASTILTRFNETTFEPYGNGELYLTSNVFGYPHNAASFGTNLVWDKLISTTPKVGLERFTFLSSTSTSQQINHFQNGLVYLDNERVMSLEYLPSGKPVSTSDINGIQYINEHN